MYYIPRFDIFVEAEGSDAINGYAVKLGENESGPKRIGKNRRFSLHRYHTQGEIDGQMSGRAEDDDSRRFSVAQTDVAATIRRTFAV